MLPGSVMNPAPMSDIRRIRSVNDGAFSRALDTGHDENHRRVVLGDVALCAK